MAILGALICLAYIGVHISLFIGEYKSIDEHVHVKYNKPDG